MEIKRFEIKRSERAKKFIPPSFHVKKSFKKRENGLPERLRSSARWQALRKMVLRREPLCFLCRAPAEEVHHIQLAAEFPDKVFEVDNLAPLCESCHSKVHSAYSRGISADVLFPEEKRIKMEA